MIISDYSKILLSVYNYPVNLPIFNESVLLNNKTNSLNLTSQLIDDI